MDNLIPDLVKCMLGRPSHQIQTYHHSIEGKLAACLPPVLLGVKYLIFISLFRVVSGEEYLHYFASDRSHMVGNTRASALRATCNDGPLNFSYLPRSLNIFLPRLLTLLFVDPWLLCTV
jgi:hypothetical protein